MSDNSLWAAIFGAAGSSLAGASDSFTINMTPGSISYVPNLDASTINQLASQYAQYCAAHMTALPLLSGMDEARYKRLTQPLEKAGVTVGEIIGWRAWRIGKAGLLMSLAVENVWEPGRTMTVRDIDKDHKVGDHDHLGIYAFKERGMALKDTEFANSSMMAFGSVRLWGDVIEHAYGWRAEFAAIESIDMVHLDGTKWWQDGVARVQALKHLRALYTPDAT